MAHCCPRSMWPRVRWWPKRTSSHPFHQSVELSWLTRWRSRFWLCAGVLRERPAFNYGSMRKGDASARTGPQNVAASPRAEAPLIAFELVAIQRPCLCTCADPKIAFSGSRIRLDISNRIMEKFVLHDCGGFC